MTPVTGPGGDGRDGDAPDGDGRDGDGPDGDGPDGDGPDGDGPDGDGPDGDGPDGDADDPGTAIVAERWFASHGLPWFVESVDVRVAALLAPRRITPVVGVVVVVGGLAGTATSAAGADTASGALVGAAVALVLLLLYAGGPLRVATMARWAAARVVSELSLLLPLVTGRCPCSCSS
jgi:hypothetical protein